MKVALIILSIALTIHSMGIQQSARSTKRILYIFDRNSNTPAVKQQLKLLTEQVQGCEERDIEIIVVPDSPQRVLLQRKYKYTGDQYMLVLVGKDGSEKYRSSSPVNPEQLFSIIDAMPMRQYEIRSRR